MNDYVYVGKIVNTHGIKGEVRLLSSFEYKDLVFKTGIELYVGSNRESLIINTYRPHKEFDMITIKGIDNINDVLRYKGLKVYVKREILNLGDKYLIEDLVGMDVLFNNATIGKVTEIMYNNSNILLHVVGEKSFYIPNNGNFVKKVNLKTKTVEVENVEGLML